MGEHTADLLGRSKKSRVRSQDVHRGASLQREVDIAFLFITHDQDEAMALSDRIALLRSGHLEQVGTPREIYQRPATVYTAQFVGQTNLLHAEVNQGLARAGALAWQSVAGNGQATFSLRPENIRLAGRVGEENTSTSVDSVRFSATVRRQVFGGATNLLELECADGRRLLARVPSRGNLEGALVFEFFGADAVRVKEEGSSV